MLHISQLIKNDLDRQGKLPLKWYDIPEKPVTDSCLLYVDAFNNTGNGTHSNSVTWKNLMNNDSATFVGTKPVWAPDSLVFSGKGGARFPRVSITSKEMTIEAVVHFHLNDPDSRSYMIYTSSAYMYTCLNTNQVAAALTKDASGLDSWSAAYIPYTAAVNQKLYLCARYTESGIEIIDMVNNVKILNPDAKIVNAFNDYIALGCVLTSSGSVSSGSAYGIKFSMYSARIHDKALTDEEIKKNYLYERKRYKF